MKTLRDMVSSIRGMHKLLSADNIITDRMIAAEIWSIAPMLVKQQTDKRRLWSSPNLFTRIDCLQMIPAALAECCDYRSPCKIRKSAKPLPKIAEGALGLLIHGVFNIHATDTFRYTNPGRYANLLQLGLPVLPPCYWLHHQHLFITTPHVEMVSLHAYFEEHVPPGLDSCKDEGQRPCLNPLDAPFHFPGYLEHTLKDIIHEKLMKTYFRHRLDPSGDLKDESQ